MKFTDEFDVFSFEFWGGAYNRVRDLSDDEMYMLEEHIRCCLGDTLPSKGDINDFVWFGCDDFFEAIDDLYKVDEDEEEDEE